MTVLERFSAVPWIKTRVLRNVVIGTESPVWAADDSSPAGWLVNCRVRSARTARDMSQDVCHRQRRFLNEFQSGRAKKTRAEHVRVKSCGAGASPREAVPSAATTPPPPHGPPPCTGLHRSRHVLRNWITRLKRLLLMYLLHGTWKKFYHTKSHSSTEEKLKIADDQTLCTRKL